MNAEVIKQQAVRFTRARSNLLLVVAFTTINIVLNIIESDIFFLFSATIPTLLLEIGRELGSEAVGIFLATVIIFVYLLCWIMAKRWRAFILVALIFFAVDALFFFFIFFEIIHNIEFTYLIWLAFQVWILFYLITGTVAWAKLRRVTKYDIDAAQNAAKAEALKKEAGSALEELSAGSDEEQEESSDQ